MLIHLTRTSGVPVYRQIVDQIKQLIAAGQLRPGMKLDPCRMLADQLHCHSLTVAKAYRRLAEDGAVVAYHGKGTIVAGRGSALSASSRRRRMARLLEHVVAEAYQLGLGEAEVGQLLADQFAAAGPAGGEGSGPAPEAGAGAGEATAGQSTEPEAEEETVLL